MTTLQTVYMWFLVAVGVAVIITAVVLGRPSK